MLVTTVDALGHFFKQDNYNTVVVDWRCRVGKVQAVTTSPMLDHTGFKLQEHPLHFQVNFQTFSTLRVNIPLSFLQKSLEEKHACEVGELSAEISALKLKVAELELLKQELEELKIEHRSVQEAKQWLERRLGEVEVSAKGKWQLIVLEL